MSKRASNLSEARLVLNSDASEPGRTRAVGRPRPVIAALTIVLVLMILVFAGSSILPIGHRLPQSVAALLVVGGQLTAALLIALRAVFVRTQRFAWALLAAALGCSALAALVSWVATWIATPLPFPSVADVGWLLLYPLAYTAFMILIRGEVRHSRLRTFLDGAIAGLGGAAAFSALVIEFLIKPSEGDLLYTAVALAYPAGDALLVGTLLCLLTVRGWKRRGNLDVLTAGMVTFAVADTIYLALVSHGAYRIGNPVDALYLIAGGLVAFAAWRREPTTTATSDGHQSPLLALPTTFALASLALLLLATGVFVSPVSIALAGVTLLLIVVRTLVSFHELREAQEQLVDSARKAGMAEIAVNVLHNVGNVLNGVNVSANLVCQKVQGSKAPGLAKAVALMHEHADNLGEFLTTDSRGKALPDYLDKLSDALATERGSIDAELVRLTNGVAHIKEIVNAQQSLAGVSGVIEPVQIADLMEDALRMAGVLGDDGVTVTNNFPDIGLLSVDKHRILLVLLNLISNATYAMHSNLGRPRQLSLRTEVTPRQTLSITVADNGSGIRPENLTQIFIHGYTTHTGGHGFGLHSSAMAATEMGGTLTVHSDGAETGAAFTLEVPLQTQAAAA